MINLNKDGVEIVIPEREDIFNLKVGDFAFNVFGKWSKVTSIYAQQDNVKGKAFVLFYTENGERSTISGSYNEDEPVMTIPVCSKFKQSCCVPRS